MVLVVPDEPDESLEEQEEGPRPKAQLDDSEASRAARKVDLDLDDAPFLEDEEEEEAAEEPPEPTPVLEAPEPKKERKPLPPWLRNKYTIIGAGSVFFLIILALVLFRGGEPKPEPEQPPVEEAAPEPVPEPEIPPEVEQDHLVRLDPFVIEERDANNDIRFLEVRLIFTTPDQNLADSLVRNTPTVRYALFYYLKNKDLTFLTDENNSDALKQELLAVVNQYMPDGRFDNLLFEQYLVK